MLFIIEYELNGEKFAFRKITHHIYIHSWLKCVFVFVHVYKQVSIIDICIDIIIIIMIIKPKNTNTKNVGQHRVGQFKNCLLLMMMMEMS